MAGIGPQLPAHLTKRKRTPEDDATVGSPPSKKAHSNGEEIALENDSSDDDDFGPPAPRAPAAASKPSMGPTLPPSNGDEIPLDDSDSDSDAGPAPAPAPRSQPQPQPQPRRIHGPAPPPANLSERPPDPADSSSSDDDDDYGPALPSSSSHQSRLTAAQTAAALSAQAGPAAPTRDEWMLAPPTPGGNRASDPTKIKARKFQTGPRANAGGNGEISSIWTETPEQKRKRLENAVLGRTDPSTDAGTSTSSSWGPAAGARAAGGGDSKLSREEEERAARIRQNVEAARGPSLYAEHQKREGGKGGRIEEEEDDPSKRAFDREKDMKLGGSIGSAQRKELLNRATDFGGRFSKGKFL